MIKFNFMLAPAAMVWLHERARELGVSVSEVLRRIVDAARGAK